MRLAPQTAAVRRRAWLPQARISGLVGLSAVSRAPVAGAQSGCPICDQQFGNCEVECNEIYKDDPGWVDCRHGCIIGYEICLAACSANPF